MKIEKVYIIGSLSNEEIPKVAAEIREEGFYVFDEWFSPGPLTDQYYTDLCKSKGWDYERSLNEYHAKHICAMDKLHLDKCDATVLVLPAGKSGHMELGYSIGQGKYSCILLDKEPEKYDIMYRLANVITKDLRKIVRKLKEVE